MTAKDGIVITARYPFTGKYAFIVVTPAGVL
jgi:hypothetical protein